MAAGRASLIVYFLFTDLLALGWQATQGLLDRHALERALMLLLPLLAGLTLGARHVARVDPAQCRRWVRRLLMLPAAVTGMRAAFRFL